MGESVTLRYQNCKPDCCRMKLLDECNLTLLGCKSLYTFIRMRYALDSNKQQKSFICFSVTDTFIEHSKIMELGCPYNLALLKLRLFLYLSTLKYIKYGD